MKQNKINHNGRRNVLVFAGFLLAAGLAVGGYFAYATLRDLYEEQCVIEDASLQVTITSGKMVKADVLAEAFGLRKGANLAQIDFDARRREILEKIPNLKAITVSRQLPDKVKIVAEERTPVARMNVRGNRSETGRVVDTEGVVFDWQRGTQMLPIIREQQAPGTAPGHRIEGRTLAALRLIESSLEPTRSELGILEVDVSKPDFLLATLGNYSRAKIAWEGMSDPTPSSQVFLNQQLDLLVMAIRSHVGDNTVIWNATDTTSKKGRIYADSKGNL